MTEHILAHYYCLVKYLIDTATKTQLRVFFFFGWKVVIKKALKIPHHQNPIPKQNKILIFSCPQSRLHTFLSHEIGLITDYSKQEGSDG